VFRNYIERHTLDTLTKGESALENCSSSRSSSSHMHTPHKYFARTRARAHTHTPSRTPTSRLRARGLRLGHSTRLFTSTHRKISPSSNIICKLPTHISPPQPSSGMPQHRALHQARLLSTQPPRHRGHAPPQHVSRRPSLRRPRRRRRRTCPPACPRAAPCAQTRRTLAPCLRRASSRAPAPHACPSGPGRRGAPPAERI